MVRWKKLLNFTCFQIGWFACAIGATGGRPLLGPLVVGVLLTLQFTLVPSPGRQCRFVLTAALLGWLVDSGLATADVFTFPFGSGLAGLCPLWMAALWANFAGTLHLSLDWLRGATGWRQHWRLRRVLGLLWRSAFWRPVLDNNTSLSLLVIAVEWGLLTPILVYLSEIDSLDGLKT